MNKIKLMTIVGTRPELIRMSSILKKFEKYFDHKLIHTNQNYDTNLNDIFFKDLNIKKPDRIFENKTNSPIKAIANILVNTERAINKYKPQIIFILGDTNSSISAIVAKRKNIPVFHYEAGNRCNDLRTPEETNRKIVDHISSINITYSNLAKNNLVREGLRPEFIFNVGSPLFEVFNDNKKKISNSKILNKLKLNRNKFIIASFHREENVDNKENLKIIVNILNSIAQNFPFKIVVSTHPRTKEKILSLNKTIINKKIIFSRPFNFSDYNCLQKNSFYVLSDSGSINEESSILGFDGINLRYTHERPEADEELVTIKTLNVQTILNLIRQKKFKNKRHFNRVSSYEVKNVSDKIVGILLSYYENAKNKYWT